jgi:myo-inositol-1(or 4)-monophosphatase
MSTSPIEFTTGLARETGELLLSYYRSSHARARLKDDRTVVTEADLAADRHISDAIHADFPGEAVLSEELHPRLEIEAESAVWVVDPLDGTTNFSLGLPFWGVSIARLVGGWPQVGVVYFPLLDELYTVELGQGAQVNGNELRTQPVLPDLPATFFSCCSRTFRNYQVDILYKPRVLGSAAYSFCCVARGIALIAFEASPKIWDIAATWLLVTEAGGVVETYDGSTFFPLTAGEDFGKLHHPTLAATTPQLLEKARSKIHPKGQ